MVILILCCRGIYWGLGCYPAEKKQHIPEQFPCWHMQVSAGWWSWSTSKVQLIMMAYQHRLAGDVADEAGHQYPILVTSIKSPASHTGDWMLVTNIQLPAPHAGAGMLTMLPESCSMSILICHTSQVDGFSYWILTNVCSTSERSNYFVYIQKKNFIKLFT